MIFWRHIKLLQPFFPLKNRNRLKSTYDRRVDFLFKKNLLLTNSITSGLFMAIGDLVIQEFEIQTNPILDRYNWFRLGRMFTIGAIMGPFHHYYYVYLDKFLPKANLKTVVLKIISDQCFASPATILFFFYGMGMLEKKTLQKTNEEIKAKFLYVYLGDCIFWPPVQFFNFYYLPTHYRVLYINAATMVFDVFLSFMKHFDQKKGP